MALDDRAGQRVTRALFSPSL